MGNKMQILNNENGSAIVVALILLAVVTIIGVSSSTTSTIELKIVRNEKLHQLHFYQAEAGAYEAAQRISEEIDPEELIPVLTTYEWLNEDIVDVDFFDSSIWVDDGTLNDNSDQSLFNQDTFYASIGKGVRPGSSLDLGSTRLYEFAAFGLSQSNSGKFLVEIGYLKRF